MNRTDSGLYFIDPDDNGTVKHHDANFPRPQPPFGLVRHSYTSSADDSKFARMDNSHSPPGGQNRRFGETRRRSVTSSSDNSVRSRSRQYGSKPSSRRTSCTLVDPTRPARHYRMQSSHTVATVNSDIDDVLALHFRSCSLFTSRTAHSNLPSPTSTMPKEFLNQGFQADNDLAINALYSNSGILDSAADEVPHTPVQQTNTTMHWTSPSTRQKEYEEIDKANSGVRGFCRRFMPRSVSGPPPLRFYDEKGDSDAGSVRRYRLDFHEGDGIDAEKDASLVQHRNYEKAVPPPKPAKARNAQDLRAKTSKRWGCF